MLGMLRTNDRLIFAAIVKMADTEDHLCSATTVPSPGSTPESCQTAAGESVRYTIALRMLQPSSDVRCSAKLKCHSAASEVAWADAAETSTSQRRRPRRAGLVSDFVA